MHAVFVDIDEADMRPGLRGDELPGDEIGMVLKFVEYDRISGPQIRSRPRVRATQVDRLRSCVAGEDDFGLRLGRVDETGYFRACSLVCGRWRVPPSS